MARVRFAAGTLRELASARRGVSGPRKARSALAMTLALNAVSSSRELGWITARSSASAERQGVELRRSQPIVRRRDHCVGEQRIENAMATVDGVLPAIAGKRIHPARRLRNGGEEGDLRPAQIGDRLVEVESRRMGDAVAV